MQNQINIAKLIQKIFRWFVLPFLLTTLGYCIFKHINPVTSNLALFAMFLCMPMLYVKTVELENKAHVNHINELMKMTRLELLEVLQEIEKLPMGYNRSLIKEAYNKTCKQKYEVDS